MENFNRSDKQTTAPVEGEAAKPLEMSDSERLLL